MSMTSQVGPSQAWADRTMRDYFSIIMRGKWIILASFLLVFGLAILYVKTTDRVYAAVVSIRIDLKQLKGFTLREAADLQTSMTVIQNELQILKSNALAEVVARRMLDRRFVDSTKQRYINIIRADFGKGSKITFTDVNEIANRVIGAVDFEPVRESEVIRLTARSTDPNEAALIANVYAQCYFDRNLYASRTRSRSFREFLESQVRDKQEALAKSEEDLRHFMEQKGVVSLDDNSKRVIEQLSQLESQRDAADITIQSIQRKLTTYSEQANEQEHSVAKVMGEANDPYISRLQSQLVQLEVQRDITVTQNPDYVGKEVYNAQLKEIDTQISLLKEKLKKRTEEFLSNLLPSSSSSEQHDPAGYLRQVKQKQLESQVELQELQARKSALTRAISEYNVQFENLPKKNMEFARLQREKLSLEKLYTAIEEKYNEANITEQGEIGYIDIFDPAVVPATPSSPKIPLNLAFGAIAGMSLGLLIVFGREYMREVIRTPEDLKKRGYPPFSTIMEIEPPKTKYKGPQHKEGGVSSQLVLLTNPFVPVAESFRHLRTTIQFARGEETPHTILFTSPVQGEGKTTTVSNLAVAFARSGKKTVLVDADMRKPNVHRMFALPMNQGLSDILQTNITFKEVLKSTLVPDLAIITSGALPSNPAEALGSERMGALIESLKQSFEVILFDCPPILAVTDCSVLASRVDRVILVVASGRTGVIEFDSAIETLAGVGAKVAGVVLNRFNPRRAYGGTMGRHTGYGYYGLSYQDQAGGFNGSESKVKRPSS